MTISFVSLRAAEEKELLARLSDELNRLAAESARRSAAAKYARTVAAESLKLGI